MIVRILSKLKSAFRPVEYAAWEMLIMRGLFGVAVLVAYLKIQTFPDAPFQIGIGHWIDLSFFHDPSFHALSVWVIAASMLAYALGFFPSVVLPLAAFLFIGAATLNTSQGKIQHHLQAGATALAVLALWHVIAALIRSSNPARLTRLRTYQLSVFFLLQTIAAAYVVSAVTKLDRSGLAWFTETKYAPVAIRKTEDAAYFNTLKVRNPLSPATSDDATDASEVEGAPPPQFAAAIPRAVQRVILDHPWTGAWILGPGLLLELFAFLALLGRPWALAVGLAIIIFHFLVGHIMNLHFHLNNHLLAIFFLNIPYWATLSYRRLTNPNKAPAP